VTATATFFIATAVCLSCVVLLVLGLRLRRRGKLTSVTLLPHQRGVLFKLGKPVRDVGPGKHRVWAGSELLVHADVRPISVNFENQVVALTDGSSAVYGFSANVQIDDIRKAIYGARNYAQIPAFVLLRSCRSQLHRSSGDSLKMDKQTVAEQISQEAQRKLASAGLHLNSFRLTRLLVGTFQPPNPQTTPRLNSSSG
jgi:hypothetical protein